MSTCARHRRYTKVVGANTKMGGATKMPDRTPEQLIKNLRELADELEILHVTRQQLQRSDMKKRQVCSLTACVL